MENAKDTGKKVKICSKEGKAKSNRNLPVAIHFKEDLIVELALMQKNRKKTNWFFSKDEIPMFAERKHKSELHPLVVSMKNHSLIADGNKNIF